MVRNASEALPYSQFINPFERCPAFAANHRATVAAHQRLDNLATLGAIERLAFLTIIIVHLFVSPPPGNALRVLRRGVGVSPAVAGASRPRTRARCPRYDFRFSSVLKKSLMTP